jgi:hypothetical protein
MGLKHLLNDRPIEFAFRSSCFFMHIAAVAVMWTVVTSDTAVFIIKGINDSVASPYLRATLSGA